MTIPAAEVNYATTALSLFTLSIRIILSVWRRERVDASFALVMISIFVVVARIIINVYYLDLGTAADALKLQQARYMDHDHLNDIKTGSMLVLAARVLMTSVLWLQISILLLFYSRITFGFTWVAWMVKITWAVVAMTFVAVILSTFLECSPTSLYWQVYPDPGYCVHAYAQLLVQAISNVVLDLMLLVIAYPIVGLKKRTVAEHVTLYTLFALGTFCIVISIIRVVSVHNSGSSQTIRSLWASVQMMVSTFVANAPSIYGSVRALRRSTAYEGNGDGGQIRRVNSRRRHSQESWMKTTDHVRFLSSPRCMIRPLPPATSFYDPESGDSSYSSDCQQELGK